MVRLWLLLFSLPHPSYQKPWLWPSTLHVCFVLDITGFLWRVMFLCWKLTFCSYWRIIILFPIFLISKIHLSQDVRFRKKELSQEMPGRNLHVETIVLMAIYCFGLTSTIFPSFLKQHRDFRLWNFPGPLSCYQTWRLISPCSKQSCHILSNVCSFIMDWGCHDGGNRSLIQSHLVVVSCGYGASVKMSERVKILVLVSTLWQNQDSRSFVGSCAFQTSICLIMTF